MERRFQDRAERGELGPVIGHEAWQGGGVRGGQARDLGGELFHVAAGQDGAARFEHQAVHRLEPHQLDLAVQIEVAGGEDVGQDSGIEEEGRPHVSNRNVPDGLGATMVAERPPTL